MNDAFIYHTCVHYWVDIDLPAEGCDVQSPCWRERCNRDACEEYQCRPPAPSVLFNRVSKT